MKPPLVTVLNYASKVISAAYLPFTCNYSRVTETATNFLHQIDLSAALSDTTFRSIVSSRSNLRICNDKGDVLPSSMLLDLTGNTLFVYFDGPKSISADTTFYLCASLYYDEVDSTAVFTNNGVTHYLPFDTDSRNLASATVWYGNAVTYGAGKFNGAVAITSVAGSVVNTPGDHIGTGDMSVSMSVNMDAGQWYHDFLMNGRFYFRYYFYGGYNGTYGVLVANVEFSQNMFLTQLSAGVWYHLTVSRESNGYVSLYINGEYIGRQSGSTPSAGYAGAVTQIGQKDNTSGYAGKIDEAIFANRLTTAGEAKDRYRVIYEPMTFYSLGTMIKDGSNPFEIAEGRIPFTCNASRC